MNPAPRLFDNVRPRKPQGSLAKRWARRAFIIPLYFFLWAVAIVTFPVPLLIAFVADLVKGNKFSLSRGVLFFVCYLTFELLGVIGCSSAWFLSGIWLGIGERQFLEWNFIVQRYWGMGIIRSCMAIFSIRLEIEQICDFGERPFIFFIRHTSPGDTLLGVYLLSYCRRIHLRYVLKRELLWDPSLELSFSRLPNYFVSRDGVNTTAEVEAVGNLMDDLGPYEGVLIYPEGTRFTEAKKARIMEKIEASGDTAALERARALRHVLPPRPGGPLKLLEKNRGADAVFCVHTGLENATKFSELHRGGIVGQVVKVRFWRVPFDAIPKDPKGQADWLHEEWKKVDDFVAENLPPAK